MSVRGEALCNTGWHRRAGCARLIERLFNYKPSILYVVFDGAGAVNNNAEAGQVTVNIDGVTLHMMDYGIFLLNDTQNSPPGQRFDGGVRV